MYCTFLYDYVQATRVKTKNICLLFWPGQLPKQISLFLIAVFLFISLKKHKRSPASALSFHVTYFTPIRGVTWNWGLIRDLNLGTLAPPRENHTPRKKQLLKQDNSVIMQHIARTCCILSVATMLDVFFYTFLFQLSTTVMAEQFEVVKQSTVCICVCVVA